MFSFHHFLLYWWTNRYDLDGNLNTTWSFFLFVNVVDSNGYGRKYEIKNPQIEIAKICNLVGQPSTCSNNRNLKFRVRRAWIAIFRRVVEQNVLNDYFNRVCWRWTRDVGEYFLPRNAGYLLPLLVEHIIDLFMPARWNWENSRMSGMEMGKKTSLISIVKWKLLKLRAQESVICFNNTYREYFGRTTDHWPGFEVIYQLWELDEGWVFCMFLVKRKRIQRNDGTNCGL